MGALSRESAVGNSGMARPGRIASQSELCSVQRVSLMSICCYVNNTPVLAAHGTYVCSQLTQN